jgi:hypothetical protein
MDVPDLAYTVYSVKGTRQEADELRFSILCEKGVDRKMDEPVWFGSPIVSSWHLPSLGDPRRNRERNFVIFASKPARKQGQRLSGSGCRIAENSAK